jgi:hypothetical protein
MKLFLTILAVIAGGWVATYHSVQFGSFFAPKFEQVRRNTYTQSESYVRGAIQDVQKLRSDYLKEKDPAVKAALAETIIQTISGVDINSFPPNLKSFIQNLQQ